MRGTKSGNVLLFERVRFLPGMFLRKTCHLLISNKLRFVLLVTMHLQKSENVSLIPLISV